METIDNHLKKAKGKQGKRKRRSMNQGQYILNKFVNMSSDCMTIRNIRPIQQDSFKDSAVMQKKTYPSTRLREGQEKRQCE